MTAAVLFLYRVATGLLLILALPYVVYRRLRHPAEMQERFGIRREADRHADRDGTPTVWLHAASLGEVEAVRAWLGTEPWAVPVRILLTVTSTSARRQAAERLGSGVEVRFVPLDFDFAVRSFLARVQPRLLLVAETEIWPVLLDHCRRRQIPVAFISARISDRAWPRTSRFRALFAAVAAAVAAVAAQSSKDADRFRRLGFTDVRVCGNVKYELPSPMADSVRDSRGSRTVDSPSPDSRGSRPADAASPDSRGSRPADAASPDSRGSRPDDSPSPDSRGSRPDDSPSPDSGSPDSPDLVPSLSDSGEFLWVVGSLRKGEEALLRAVARAREEGLHVVLAPRHLREREHWAEAVRAAGMEPCMRSTLNVPIDWERPMDWLRDEVGPDRLLVVDVHGELRAWYGHASAASVGGTWVPIGGHSLFEPASLGVPVSFGPFTANVEDVAEALLEEGGGMRFRVPEDVWSWIQGLLDPAEAQKTERSALRAARRLASAGKRTRAYLFERLGSKEGGGWFRPEN